MKKLWKGFLWLLDGFDVGKWSPSQVALFVYVAGLVTGVMLVKSCA